MGAPSPVLAERAAVYFNIPAGPLAGELIAFAVQANVSIDTQNAASCVRTGRPLIGRFTPMTGLARILAGSGCRPSLVGSRAFALNVSRSPKPARRPDPPALVRAPAPRGDDSLAPLIVVATGQPTPADRLAYSVTAITGQTLMGQGVWDASELAEVTPSMIVTNLGMGRDKILLRGLSDGPLTGNTQSMVGVYLDDVRLTFNAPDPDLRLTDVQRIEVLRGPQGALYGAGSLGGVVHIVTVPPDPHRLEAWAAASYGVTDGGAPSQSLDGVVNLPLLKGRAGARLVLYRESDGGYLDNTQLGLTNTNGTLREGGRLALALDLNSRWSVTLGGVFQNINSNDTQYVDAGGPLRTRNSAILEPYDNDFREIHLSSRGDIGWAEAKVSVAYIHHALDSRYDATTSPPLALPTGPAAFDETDAIDSLVSEATLASPSSAPIQWLLGAFYAHTEESRGAELLSLISAPVAADRSNRHDLLTEAALYGEVVFPLAPSLDLTTGGRLFSYRDTVASTVFAPGTGSVAPFGGQANRLGLAPKLVLSFTPTPNLITYVQAAEGYRGNGLNTADSPSEIFGSTPGAGPLRAYGADELWGLEAGAKVSLLKDRLHLRSAVFQAYWTGVQSDQILASGLPYTANIGDGRNTGVELEAEYLDGPLDIHGSLLADHPELVRAYPGFQDLAGSNLGASPEVITNADIAYWWPLWTRYQIALDGRIGYVGPSQLSLSTVPTRTMAGYLTGRLAATLSAEPWQIIIAADNPANIQGDTFAYGNPFALRTQRQVTPLRPRTATVTLRVSY